MIKLKHILDGVVVSEITVTEGEYRIGRSEGNDIQLDDAVVSGKHAIIDVKRSPYMDAIFEITITDSGSTNGTYVNNLNIKNQRLKHGDQIRIGTHEFKIYDDQAGVNTQTEFYVPEN